MNADLSSNFVRRAGVGCLIVGLVIAAGLQFSRSKQQREENERLRAQLLEAQQALDELRLEKAGNLRTSSRPLSDTEKEELLRLRNQAAQLKAATNEAQRLRSDLRQATDENERMRMAQANVSSALSSRAAPADSFPKESWTFAGYATPEASIQSLVWAMSQGDSQRFLAALAPEERARVEKSWQNKSAEQIGEEGRREMQKVSGFRILERRQIADDQVALTIFANGKGDTVDMLLQRIGSDWKFAGRTGRQQSPAE